MYSVSYTKFHSDNNTPYLSKLPLITKFTVVFSYGPFKCSCAEGLVAADYEVERCWGPGGTQMVLTLQFCVKNQISINCLGENQIVPVTTN